MRKESKKLGYICILIGIIICVCMFLCLSINSYDIAYASSPSYYQLSFSAVNSDIVSGDAGKTYKVYVNKDAYDSAYELQIQYDIVKIKVSDSKNSLELSNGVIQGRESTLKNESGDIEYIVINKGDLVASSGTVPDNQAYYFTVHATMNCAIVFKTYYRLAPSDELNLVYNTDYILCQTIDTEAPRIKGKSEIWSSGQCKLTLSLSDLDEYSAASGIKSISLYNGDTLIKTDTINSATSTSYSATVDYGNYTLNAIIRDKVGNERNVVVKKFSDDSYDSETEILVRNALVKMEAHQNAYASSLYSDIALAYNDYIEIISNSDSTTAEKETALLELKKAYQDWYQIDSNEEISYELKILNNEYIKDIELLNAKDAFSFCKKGETLTITITLAYLKYSKDNETYKYAYSESKGELENIENFYRLTVETTSSETGKVSQEFTTPLILKFSIEDEYTNLASVQIKYAGNGNTTTFENSVSEYTNGQIALTCPNSVGAVYLFLETEKKKNLYWLFAFAAIPLLIGIGGFVYAKVRLDKNKKNMKNNKQTDDDSEIASKLVAEDKKNEVK